MQEDQFFWITPSSFSLGDRENVLGEGVPVQNDHRKLFVLYARPLPYRGGEYWLCWYNLRVPRNINWKTQHSVGCGKSGLLQSFF